MRTGVSRPWRKEPRRLCASRSWSTDRAGSSWKPAVSWSGRCPQGRPRLRRRFARGGQRDVVRGAFVTDGEPANTILHLAVGTRGPLMLAKVLRPRLHEPAFHTALGVRGVDEQLPEHGAVALADRAKQLPRGGGKGNSLSRLDRVLHNHEHRSRLVGQFLRDHRIRPVAGGLEIEGLGRREAKPRDEPKPEN